MLHLTYITVVVATVAWHAWYVHGFPQGAPDKACFVFNMIPKHGRRMTGFPFNLECGLTQRNQVKVILSSKSSQSPTFKGFLLTIKDSTGTRQKIRRITQIGRNPVKPTCQQSAVTHTKPLIKTKVEFIVEIAVPAAGFQPDCQVTVVEDKDTYWLSPIQRVIQTVPVKAIPPPVKPKTKRRKSQVKIPAKGIKKVLKKKGKKVKKLNKKVAKRRGR